MTLLSGQRASGRLQVLDEVMLDQLAQEAKDRAQACRGLEKLCARQLDSTEADDLGFEGRPSSVSLMITLSSSPV